MSPNFHIALRFLTAKKRAMVMSLSCTVLGVGLFIVTQATTSGFEEFFVRTLLATDGAMRIEDRKQETMKTMEAAGDPNTIIRLQDGFKLIEGVEEPEDVEEVVRSFANVRGVSPVIRGNVQVTSPLKTEDGQVLGINLDKHRQVSELERKILTPGGLGKFQATPNSVLMGKVMAERLDVRAGDHVVVTVRGETRRYQIAGIFETGVRDYDKTRIYLDIIEAKSLLHRPTGVTLLQISLYDAGRAREDAAHMEEVLKHSVRPWQEREKDWLNVFKALRVSSAITVTIFTLIASLAMFNTLAMIVMQKTKDIAILRSMGYERKDITSIFLWQAAIVLAVGAILGALFGVVVTWGVSQVPLPINTLFKTETFIVSWNPWHYVQAISTAVVMVMIASLAPARRAARFEPGDIVRGTAQ
jgi:lipoprotein-releasing system permease protein